MKCPRCEAVVLEEIDRNGITVDRCASCRGIWLDRGELEKLLAHATAEIDAGAPGGAPPPRDHERSRYGYDDREPPSSRPGRYGHRHRRSFWHELFD